jgi:chromosome segregation ATPase
MNRRSAAMVAILIISCVAGSPASAGEPACERLQADLAERDQEVARHREYSSQLFKQLEAARSELQSSERANAEARARANDAALKARREILDYEVSRQKELAARDKDLDTARGEVVSLRAEIGSLKKTGAELQHAVADRDAKLAQEAKARSAAETSLQGVSALRGEIAKLEASLRESIAERDDVVAKREALARQWEKQNRTLSAQLEESQKQIATLAAHGKELEAARGEIASLKKETAELRAAAAEREAKLTEQANAGKAVATSDDAVTVRLAKLDAPRADERLEKRVERPVAAVAVAAAEPPAPSASSQQSPGLSVVAGIKKWQLPDGTLFFGERPRIAGSKLVGEVQSMGTSGGSQVD